MGGCIIGECWVCGDLIYETDFDEFWLIKYGEFIHEGCRREAEIIRPNNIMQVIQTLKKLTAQLDKLEEMVKEEV